MTGNTRCLRTTTAVLLALALLAAPALAGPLEKAQAAVQAKDWPTAAEQFALVLQKTPEHRVAALGLAEAAVKAGKTELYYLAEDGLLGLREKNARDWEVVIALGRISLAQSAAKDDTLAKKSYDTQAAECFGTVLDAQPANEDAAAGMAEVHFQSAQFQRAIEVVDRFLAAKPTSSAKALYWKGQALYFLAQDAWRAGGSKLPVTSQIAQMFRKAQGAYRGASAGMPDHFEAWMQLGYASAWLDDRAAALEGYRKALVLDPESALPLKGVESLLKSDPAALEGELRKIVAEHPKHVQGLYYLAHNRYQAGEHRAAADLFERHAKVARRPANGWYWLGKAAAQAGDETRAVRAYEKALEADPDHVHAAWELDVRIQKSGAMQRARQSLADAKKVIQQYAPLLKLAPRNASVRNNLGFVLREAYVAHQGSKKWIPILEASVEQYVQASEILGEWTAEKEATLTWQQRYGQAQIISDTGLMFQFYEPTRDYDKATEYYERALEYTEDGYRDAFVNYARILSEQERWDDLYELARACAESVKTEQGQPDEPARNQARAIVEKLLRSGKVKD